MVPGDDDRQPLPALLEQGLDGEDRRLGVQRVEDGLEQDQVDAAVDEARERLAVGRDQLVEVDVAKARIVDVGRDRRGLAGRPEHAGDEARPRGIARRMHSSAASRASRAARRLSSYTRRVQAVVGLRRRVRVEGVGLDDVGAGREVLGVDLADDLRLRQREQVVVALQVARPKRRSARRESRLPRAGSPGSWCPWRRPGSGCGARAGRAVRRFCRAACSSPCFALLTHERIIAHAGL